MHQRRWLKLINDYDLSFNYHEEKANVVADALSQKRDHGRAAWIIAIELRKEMMALHGRLYGKEKWNLSCVQS